MSERDCYVEETLALLFKKNDSYEELWIVNSGQKLCTICTQLRTTCRYNCEDCISYCITLRCKRATPDMQTKLYAVHMLVQLGATVALLTKSRGAKTDEQTMALQIMLMLFCSIALVANCLLLKRLFNLSLKKTKTKLIIGT
ncbi:hypothetical protein D918_04734 [Trichuris suis]|nr:hypothetical protein D918_04734 [Trichuris suis]